MSAVTMYCSAACVYCREAEKLLKKKRVKINKIRVDKNKRKLNEMIERTGRHTVPQIYIGETHVGGFDDLLRLEKLHKLDALLQRRS